MIFSLNITLHSSLHLIMLIVFLLGLVNMLLGIRKLIQLSSGASGVKSLTYLINLSPKSDHI